MARTVHSVSWRKTSVVILCWLLAVVSLGAAAPLIFTYLDDRTAGLSVAGPQAFYALIELAAIAFGLFCFAWITAVLTLLAACCALRAGHRGWARGESILRALTPRTLRHVLAAVLGLGISATTLLPAHATTEPDPFDVPLQWSAQTVSAPPEALRLTSDQEIAAVPIAVSNQVEFRFEEEAVNPGKNVSVAPGDSLWKIAKRHLPAGATDAEIDQAWRQWYALNEELIGANPNHIEPGMTLIRPV